MNQLTIHTDSLPVEASARLQAWAVEAKAAQSVLGEYGRRITGVRAQRKAFAGAG